MYTIVWFSAWLTNQLTSTFWIHLQEKPTCKNLVIKNLLTKIVFLKPLNYTNLRSQTKSNRLLYVGYN